ncbi:hypothetical protein [Nocardia brevicatena]|uniref:hypothetical protein n=1 Tax=Nocardia brevicatena TaxID=37327 RepID=UPI0002EC77C4|nr:hypothetical protein [Nocardia brevicatena]
MIASRPVTQSGKLLAAYSDLCSNTGPIHARVATDLGARLQSGAWFPAYQVATPPCLRAFISMDAPNVPYLEDPRELPVDERSKPWQLMCVSVDKWHALEDMQRLRIGRVLAKLGFWQFVADLIEPGDEPCDTLETLSLSHLRAVARHQLDERDTNAVALLAETRIAMATNEQLPIAARLASAVYLTVHYVRKQRDNARARRWQTYATSLRSSVRSDSLPWVLNSVYWRAVSYIPYLEGNHRLVSEMLDQAEECAIKALDQAAEDSRLAALENMGPLFETRGRAAWDVGDLATAETYYRRLVDHDPWDAKGHVRLADFLRDTGQSAQARESYSQAAELGAPYTIYAQTQADQCT